MTIRVIIGVVIHFILGLLLPYVVVGSVVLLYGFMSPPTDAEKTRGLLIALLYLGVLIVANWRLLRGIRGKGRMQAFLIHLAVFFIAAASMFISLRWS